LSSEAGALLREPNGNTRNIHSSAYPTGTKLSAAPAVLDPDVSIDTLLTGEVAGDAGKAFDRLVDSF
jgi:hypothetical protein